MSKEPITPASLTAFLAVHSIAPSFTGTLSMRTPVVGRELAPDQRRELGFPADGRTLVYDLDGVSVVLNLAGNTATISFAKVGADKAIETFDRIVRRDQPLLRQTEDVNHPRGGRKRLRVYQGDLDPARLVKIEVDYPSAGASGADLRFVVRVSGFERRSS